MNALVTRFQNDIERPQREWLGYADKSLKAQTQRVSLFPKKYERVSMVPADPESARNVPSLSGEDWVLLTVSSDTRDESETLQDHVVVARSEELGQGVPDASWDEPGDFATLCVVYSGRLFHLREWMKVSVAFKDGLWLCEYAPLGIIAFGTSRHEARDAFNMEFASCWGMIAEADDAELTEGAQKLKRDMKALVSSVEEL